MKKNYWQVVQVVGEFTWTKVWNGTLDMFESVAFYGKIAMRVHLKTFLILFSVVCVVFGIWYEKRRYEWRRTIPLAPWLHKSDVPGFPDHVSVEFKYREIVAIIEEAKQKRQDQLARLTGFQNLKRVMHLDVGVLERLTEELRNLRGEQAKLREVSACLCDR